MLVYVAAVAATTDHHVGHSLSPRKEAQGTADELLTAALTVISSGVGRQAAAGRALWGPTPFTGHSLYLGLFSFIVERLLCVGNKALTAALHKPGVGESSACGCGDRRPKQGVDSPRHIPRDAVPESTRESSSI